MMVRQREAFLSQHEAGQAESAVSEVFAVTRQGFETSLPASFTGTCSTRYR